MPAIFTYQKKDKLKSRKQTQELFSTGHSITQPPLKLIYTIQPAEPGLYPLGLVQAGVGAPSRIFRKSVQRNRVKRLLREGYRLEKPYFLSQALFPDIRINLFFLYIDATVISQKEIQEKIKTLLNKLTLKLPLAQ